MPKKKKHPKIPHIPPQKKKCCWFFDYQTKIHPTKNDYFQESELALGAFSFSQKSTGPA